MNPLGRGTKSQLLAEAAALAIIVVGVFGCGHGGPPVQTAPQSCIDTIKWGLDAEPIRLKIDPPDFPYRARDRGGRYVAWVVVTVAPSGNVATAEICLSSGDHEVDAAACTCAKTAQFSPPTRKGQPVSWQTALPITFVSRK